jgi:hypothetical protein
VGEIADRAATLYRREFALFFSVGFLPDAALYVLVAGFLFLGTGAGYVSEATAVGVMAVRSGILMIGYLFVIVLRMGATAAVVSDRYLGRPTSLRRAYGQALRAWPRVFATLVIGWLIVGAGFTLGMLPGTFVSALVVAASPNKVLGGILGMFAFVLSLGPGFFLFLRLLYAVFVPVVPVVEGQWAIDGLVRSWRLMSYRSPEWGRYSTSPYRATALFLLLLGIYMAVVFLAQLPHVALMMYQSYKQLFEGGPISTDPTMGAPLWLLIPVQILALTAQALTVPYTAAVFTVYYYDLRVRREGMDLFQEMREAESAREEGRTEPAGGSAD